MAMNFEELQQRIDFFDKTFTRMTQSVKEFIDKLEGGDSSRFKAYIEQLDEMSKKALNEKKALEESAKAIRLLEEAVKKLTEAKEKGAAVDKDLKENEKLLDEVRKRYDEQEESVRKLQNEMEGLNKTVSAIIEGTDKVAAGFKLFSYHTSTVYKILKSFKGTSKDMDTLALAFDTVKGRIKDLIEPANLLSGGLINIFQATKTMVMSLNDSIKSFEHTTGIVGTYNDLIWDGYDANMEYSVSLDTVRESTQFLVKDMNSFNLMSMQSRLEMVKLVSLYEKFGASTFELGEALGSLVDTFGVTETGAASFLQEMRGLHNNIGGLFRQIIDDYEDSLNRLARHGMQQSLKAFKELSVMAKSLRLDYKELFEVVDQFDTYDSASEAVSRFNAIAGGPYLNTISLMRQSEDERAKSLISAIQQSKINYELLSAQEKQAMAASIGIKDMSIAQRIFTGSLEDYYRLRTITNEQEEVAKKKAEQMASIQDKLNTIFENFAILVEDILAIINTLLGLVKDLFVGFKDNFWLFAAITGGIIAITLAIKAWISSSLLLSSIIPILGIKFAGFLTVIKSGTGVIGFFGKMVAGVVSIVGKAFTGIIGGIFKFFAAIGPAIYAAAPAMFVGALAIAAIAGAIWLVAKAIQAVVDIFSGSSISNEEASIVERMASVPVGTDKKIDALSDSLENLSNKVSDINYSKLEKMVSILEEIGDQTERLNNTAVISVTRNISDLFDSAGKITSTNTVEIKNIATEIIRISKETYEEKIKAAKELFSPSSSGNKPNQSAQQVTNVIELNGREMARWFSGEINKMGFSIGK